MKTLKTIKESKCYLARSSGVIGLGYACSISSRTFSGVNGTMSNSSFSIDTEIEFEMKSMKLNAAKNISVQVAN